MFRKHLIIPDAHACPKDNFRRFEWLGELILTEMPDVIVDIGDWWDMPSLCSYDKGTKSFEGRRYRDDIEAGHKADTLAFGPIVKYNNTRSRSKKKQYHPQIIRCRGNHDYRIKKAVERQAELDGVIGLNDINTRLSGLDFTHIPFLTPYMVDGICYSHYFVSGVMGRPVSSATAMLAKHHVSCTAGHVHSRDWSESVRSDGVRIQALISGVFLDPDHESSYADDQSSRLWWSGLHIKNRVKDGDYDRTEISINALKAMMEGT